MFVRGYIDESYGQRIFTLSCLVAIGSKWMWFSSDWKKCIRRVNKRLRAQGRKTIKRYHASDCSNCLNDFAGWSRDEQIAFTSDLLVVFQKHSVDTTAYSVDLQDFSEVFPGVKPGEETLVSLYGLLMKFLLSEMGSRYCQRPETKMALIHERSPYDGVLARAFNQMMNDPGFAYKHSFTSLTSASWEDCIPLQPADLVAYENMKETERRVVGRRRRKSLELLLDLGSFGGRGRFIQRDGLLVLKKIHDAAKQARSISASMPEDSEDHNAGNS